MKVGKCKPTSPCPCGFAIRFIWITNPKVDKSVDYKSTPIQGNLESWTDNLTNQKEEFIYDEQNRLTDWLTYAEDSLVKAHYVAYDVNTGNIITKSGINFEMVYGEEDNGPHAITSIKGKPSSFSMNDRGIDYTDFSKVEEITEGGKTLNITYGVNNRRVKMRLDDGNQPLTRYYQPNFEEEIQGESSRKIHYISATDGLAAIYVQEEDKDSLYYAYTDHLGSLVAIADEAGNPAERFSYDPWGNRRDPDDWTNRITTPVSQITGRGYTMHEHLDEFDLINMNGRVYDPLTSRFLSPDPYIQAPGQWLNYDRYAYAMNNPLLYTDPSGYFFKDAWDWFWDKLNAFAGEMDQLGISGGFNVSFDANLSGGGVSSTYQSAGGNALNAVNFATGSEFYSQLHHAAL